MKQSGEERNIATSYVVAVGVQCVLSLVALVLDLTESCNACSTSTNYHPFIAGIGTAAYFSLLCLGVAGQRRAFFTGIYIAAGVHSALLGWSFITQSVCGLCVVSGSVAFLLAGVSLSASRLGMRWASIVYAGSGLSMIGLLWAAMTPPSSHHDAATEAIPRVIADQTRSHSEDPLRVTVYEKEGCGYCEDFRNYYAPRLKEDFGSRVLLTYRKAVSYPHIQRTPTIEIESGTRFPGLPTRYEDLHHAVLRTLDRRRS